MNNLYDLIRAIKYMGNPRRCIATRKTLQVVFDTGLEDDFNISLIPDEKMKVLEDVIYQAFTRKCSFRWIGDPPYES